MEEEKLGIKNLKEAVKLGLSLGELAEGCLKGIDAADAIKLVEVVQNLAPAYQDYKQVPLEYKDLDAQEKAELKDFIESEFDLESDSTENVVETALKIIVDISAIMELFKK